MAKDKICRPFVGIIAPENKFTVDTIDDLKSRNYLTIGDIVDLNGYYTAGDGAHHKRKIESTDDGSGVQLANGLWANIVHNGEVNVSWFGAKPYDVFGAVDNSEILNKTFSLGVKRYVVSKNYFIAKKVVLVTDATYNFAAKLILDNSFVKDIDDCVVLLNGFSSAETFIFNLSIITTVFLDKDRHNVKQIQVEDVPSVGSGFKMLNKRRVSLKDITVVGIRTKPLFVAGGYETKIDGADLWFSGVEENEEEFEEKITLIPDTTQFTIGAYLKINDAIIENIVSVGFNIGMWINSKNTVDGFHPWSYGGNKLVYGVVLNGNDNIFSNIYLDSLSPVSYRKSAGFYELKKRDIPNVSTIFGNVFVSVTILYNLSEDASVFEFGDIENIDAGTSNVCCKVTDVWKIKDNLKYVYRLHRSASESSLSENMFKEDCVFVEVPSGITDIKKLIDYIFENNSARNFRTIKFNYDITNFKTTNNLKTNLSGQCSFKLECIKKNYYWKMDIFGNDNLRNEYATVHFYRDNRFSAGSSTTTIRFTTFMGCSILDTAPESTASYGLGQILYIKNRPYWKASDGYLKDANGVNYSNTVSLTTLDTPYHTTKMQQLGIYDDFISYMDSQHEYDKEQKALESAKQEAYQLALAENSELVYEDWLASYPELMPVHQEPAPSERLMEFYNEYK